MIKQIIPPYPPDFDPKKCMSLEEMINGNEPTNPPEKNKRLASDEASRMDWFRENRREQSFYLSSNFHRIK